MQDELVRLGVAKPVNPKVALRAVGLQVVPDSVDLEKCAIHQMRHHIHQFNRWVCMRWWASGESDISLLQSSKLHEKIGLLHGFILRGVLCISQ